MKLRHIAFFLSLLVLGLDAIGQSIHFEEDYGHDRMWDDAHVVGLYNGNLLYSPGYMEISSGAVQYVGVGGRAEKRVYRKLGTVLSNNSWTVSCEFYPQSAGSQGTGHYALALTAGTLAPWRSADEVSTSAYGTYTLTDQDGVMVSYIYAGGSYYFELNFKNGTTRTASTNTITAGLGTTYRLELSRSGANFTLAVYNASTSALIGSFTESSGGATDITDLSVIQHGVITGTSYLRTLTGTLDKLTINDSSLPCVSCGATTLSLDNTQNYILSETMREPVTTDQAADALALGDQRHASLAYFDGLGRPLQEVAIQAAPDCGGDIISFHQYNSLGQEPTVYLPYVDGTGNPGSYRSQAETEQDNFFSSTNFPHWGTDVDYPYAVTDIEPSPLARVIEQGSPGADWQLAQKTIYKVYEVNNYTEQAFITDAGPGDGPYTYPIGSLRIETTEDENGALTEVYTDKLGRTLFQKVQINPTQWALTHYIYDDFGRVKYVLQPEGWEEVQYATLTQDLLDRFAFQYKYDKRGRIKEKKVPGADWVYLVYDPLDRVIMTQDGNLRDSSRYLVTKYDALGRPVVTGSYASSLDQASMQSAADTHYGSHELFESKDPTATHEYTLDESFPDLSVGSAQVLSVTFYDTHDWAQVDSDHDGREDIIYANATGLFPDNIVSERTRGLVTMIKVASLNPDSDMNDWMWTFTHYDKYGRELQTISTNHIAGGNTGAGSDIVEYDYAFSGELEFSLQSHATEGTPDEEILIKKNYTYSPQGKVVRMEQRTEALAHPDSAEFVTLSEYHFDILGQTQQKKLHFKAGADFLQTVDYQYNIKGWLEKLNDPSSLGADLFALELDYNSGSNAQYNGNISAMQWRTGDGITSGDLHAYDFSYDSLNRLKEADYAHNSSDQNYFDVNLSYDKNGNIETLKRYGPTGSSSYGLLDDLSYNYSWSSTRQNRLHGVTDQSSNSYGVDQFLDDGSSSNQDYTYDANGNLSSDSNKGISTITYNHLNKPTIITFSDGRKIEYLYDATGTKLRQKVFDSSSTLSSQLDYINAFHYEDSDGAGSNPLALSFITHEEGRVRETSTGRYYYEMQLQDHLGNNRILFADLDDDGVVEKKQEDHFYPFGMRMAVSGTTTASPPNRYLYNGKELQTDHGLNWSDYGARMYDASIARWNGVDPHSENYFNSGIYNYVLNNPIKLIDPDGKDAKISIKIAEDGTIYISLSTTVHVFGNKVTDESIKWLQAEWDSYNSLFALNPDEVGGAKVLINIDVTYKNVNSKIPASQRSSSVTGTVYGNLLSKETKQRLGWKAGDNLMQVDELSWNKYVYGRQGPGNQAAHIAFSSLLSNGSQVNPGYFGGPFSSGVEAAQQEVMHMMGFDERYPGLDKGSHEGFSGDTQGMGTHDYIHAQHFYDIYSFVIKNDLAVDGASKVMQEALDGNQQSFDDTRIGQVEKPSRYNADGSIKE